MVAGASYVSAVTNWSIPEPPAFTLSGRDEIVRYGMILARSGWNPPPDDVAWPQDEVHVWRATLDWSAEAIADLEPILAPDERERMRRFHFERDRRCHLVARGLLRTLLGRYLGMAPASCASTTARSGSQAWRPIWCKAPAVQRFARRRARPDRGCRRPHAGHRRRAHPHRHRGRGDRRAFFRRMNGARWPRLPAICNTVRFSTAGRERRPISRRSARACRCPWTSSTCPSCPASRRGLATRPDPAEAGRWCLQGLDVADGYKAALAVEGAGWTLRCWDWPAPRGRAYR